MHNRTARLSLACGFILFTACNAYATPVAVGALSSNDDGSTEVISDARNSREWLRWDVLAHLSYADTLSAIGPGGAYEGWQIAEVVDAQLFVDALFSPGGHGCSASPVGTTETCGHLPPGTHLTALVGDNFATNQDFAWILGGNLREVGLVELLNLPGHGQDGRVIKMNNWSNIALSDYYSENGFYSANPISWLMYRAVPEPATLLLLGLGLAGLGITKKQT